MAWLPPEDDEIIDESTKASTRIDPRPSATWAPPEGDEIIVSPLEKAVSTIHTGDVTPPELPEGIPAKVSYYLKKIMKAHNPFPTSMEELKGALSPSPGKMGAGRLLEEEGKRIGKAVRGSAMNLSEDFVSLPGVREFPRTAAGIGATGSAIADLLSDSLTPSGAAQAIGAEPVIGGLRGLKGLELAARARIGSKISGLPSHVARAIKENPEFFSSTKGTPHEIEASNQALKDIIEGGRQDHIAKTTAARKSERAGQLGEVESGVRDIQDVINRARSEAGEKYGKVKEELGLEKSLLERAQEIAKGGIRELKEPEVIRKAMGALDPQAPRGKESIANLLKIRQDIDNLVTYSRRGIKPVPAEVEAVLLELRGRINNRIGGVTEPIFNRSVMGVEYGEPIGKNDIGAQLREADKAFSETAGAVEGLTPKFSTVPKGVSTIRTQASEGLRSIDPDVAALESLAGGREALRRAEMAVSAFDVAEKGFKEELKKFDPLTGKFEDPIKGAETVWSSMSKGLEEVDPDMNAIRQLKGGPEALEKMKAEVNRFDAERVDITPNDFAESVAQIVGITPQRAARWLSQSVHGGAFPGLSRAAAALGRAVGRGPQALTTQHFLLMQNDDDYRQAIQALQQGGK